MAKLTFEIPARTIDAFAKLHGYKPLLGGLPNPQTKEDMVATVLISFLKSVTVQSEFRDVSKSDLDAIDADVKQNVVITKESNKP